jgi:deoxyribodipyrimidine photo-lyase
MDNNNIPKIRLSIFWFRRDLRLTDNHGLYEALRAGQSILPIFIFDTDILDSLKDKKDKRVNFIYRQLQTIQKELLGVKSSLYILHGHPKTCFEKLMQDWNVDSVYTNHDYEPYAVRRDQDIANFLLSQQIPFYTFKDQVIFEKEEITKKDGHPYTVYTPYSKSWKEKYFSQENIRFPSEQFLDHFYKTAPFSFPSLKSIGFEKIDLEIPYPQLEKEVIVHYEETRNLPFLPGTSRMSVHLRFGTVSIRELAAYGSKWNVTWLNELIWREFFMMILYHFPRVVTDSFKTQYDRIPWRNNEPEFQLWCNGETGYPLVDAGMRELNETGFMHNRVRMVVASFLTKHLLIDWRCGEAYFAEKLLDYELASNNGNWQWCAGCGCDAAPYFRIFNPTTQQEKFDPDFIYIKRWIPGFQTNYISPIVDHAMARQKALEVFKNALQD